MSDSLIVGYQVLIDGEWKAFRSSDVRVVRVEVVTPKRRWWRFW